MKLRAGAGGRLTQSKRCSSIFGGVPLIGRFGPAGALFGVVAQFAVKPVFVDAKLRLSQPQVQEMYASTYYFVKNEILHYRIQSNL